MGLCPVWQWQLAIWQINIVVVVLHSLTAVLTMFWCSPLINQSLLEFVRVIDATLVHTLLYDAPNLVL